MANLPQEWHNFISPVVGRAGRQCFRREVREARKGIRKFLDGGQIPFEAAGNFVRSKTGQSGKDAVTVQAEMDHRELWAVALTAVAQEADEKNHETLFKVMGHSLPASEQRPQTIDELVGAPFEHAIMPQVTDPAARENLLRRKFQASVKSILESKQFSEEEVFAVDASGLFEKSEDGEWNQALQQFYSMSNAEKKLWREKVLAYPAP